MSAIDIQRHYLTLAESQLQKPWMPPWAPEVCRRWREMLDGLHGDFSYARTRLDWGIKLAIYSEYARRAGIVWEKLRIWNALLCQLNAARQRMGLEARALNHDLLFNPASPLFEEVVRLAPSLDEQGISREGLERFIALRGELLEADVRYGQVGGKGIFHALDSAGMLEHHVRGVDEIEAATRTPPTEGRARIRGEVIRRFAGEGACCCDWQAICDMRGERLLDLSDPFEAGEKWKDLPIHYRGIRTMGERQPPVRSDHTGSECQ